MGITLKKFIDAVDAEKLILFSLAIDQIGQTSQCFVKNISAIDLFYSSRLFIMTVVWPLQRFVHDFSNCHLILIILKCKKK